MINDLALQSWIFDKKSCRSDMSDNVAKIMVFGLFWSFFFDLIFFFRLENESVKHCLTHRENRKSKSFFVLEISPGHGVLFSTSVEL